MILCLKSFLAFVPSSLCQPDLQQQIQHCFMPRASRYWDFLSKKDDAGHCHHHLPKCLSLPPHHPPSWGKLKHAHILLVLISQFHQILLFSAKESYNTQLYPSNFQIIFSSVQPSLINYCRKISFSMSVAKSRLSHTTSLTLLNISCWESRHVTLQVLL